MPDANEDAILEFLSLWENWRASYAAMKRGLATRMNHVRLIAGLRDLERDGRIVREPVATPEGGQQRFEYALPTEDLLRIRAWEWAPEQVLGRLRGLDRQPTDDEYIVHGLALRARPRSASVLGIIKSMPGVKDDMARELLRRGRPCKIPLRLSEEDLEHIRTLV